jgi:hypothetical protein
VYPFQHWQAQGGVFGDFFESLSPTAAVAAAAQILVFLLVLMRMEDRPVAVYFIALGIAVILCIHAKIDWARSISIRAAPRRRSRYFWALSFWDVGQARKILSGVPNPIPSGAVFVDLALMTSLIAVCFVLWWRGWDDSNESLQLAKIYLTTLPAISAITYGVRLAFLIYFRLQWYFSTFEYRTDGKTSPRVKVALRFISTSLQTNFHTQIISLIAILFIVSICAIFIDDLKAGNSFKELVAKTGMLILFILLACLCLAIISLVFGTSMITRDTRRRIQWIYEGNSAVSSEASGRNIQLV